LSLKNKNKLISESKTNGLLLKMNTTKNLKVSKQRSRHHNGALPTHKTTAPLDLSPKLRNLSPNDQDGMRPVIIPKALRILDSEEGSATSRSKQPLINSFNPGVPPDEK